MTLNDQLWAKKRNEPFVPFRIVTYSGKVYEINHENGLLPMKSAVTVGIPTTAEDPFWDSAYEVPYEQIASLEPVPPVAVN